VFLNEFFGNSWGALLDLMEDMKKTKGADRSCL